MRARLTAVAAAAGLLLSPVYALSAEDIPSDTPVSSLLSSAQSHLSKGETSSALLYFDAALARDPQDYLTYFKRATTYLSLGRTSQATDDFNKVLDLKPGFEGAHVQLGKLKQRTADWDGAKEQFTKAGRAAGSKELVELEEAQGAAKLAEGADLMSNWEECVNQAGAAIMVANRAPYLREIRARCRFARGEMEEGMNDLQHVLNLRPGNTKPHVLISAVHFYALGDTEKGMAQIRKCLHSDPESKVCKKLLKQEKAIDKTLAKVTKAFGKKQPSTGSKYLVPSANGEDEGLIKEIKDQDQALRDDGTIPATAPKLLIAKVVGLACEGYYEVRDMR
jgi:DnaJ homolog subfamily C member 3